MPENFETNTYTEAEIDTDEPEHRLKRAINHYDFEQKDLEATFGLSFQDRFTQVRLSLFKGFSNISGEDHVRLLAAGKVLSNYRSHISDAYMPSDEVAEVAHDGYIPMVDGWFQAINEMPDGSDKQETVYRMLAAMFVGGVLIHPTRDGNGQTFKGLVLSYLHDLLPSHRDRFIPIKYDVEHHSSGHEMAISFMGGGRLLAMENDLTAGRVPEIEPKSQKDRQLIGFIREAKRQQDTVS